jgi:hypothetical protein
MLWAGEESGGEMPGNSPLSQGTKTSVMGEQVVDRREGKCADPVSQQDSPGRPRALRDGESPHARAPGTQEPRPVTS